MPYGELSDEMRELLAPVVQDKRVYDLGCGEMGHSVTLLELGAEQVTATDKHWPRAKPPDGVIFYLRTFLELNALASHIQGKLLGIAFVSWPDNHRLDGLLELLERFEIVVYLGCNLDGSACGWPDLFRSFSGRKIVATHSTSRNTMIIYGESVSSPRELLPEEHAAIENHTVFSYGTYDIDDLISTTNDRLITLCCQVDLMADTCSKCGVVKPLVRYMPGIMSAELPDNIEISHFTEE